MKNHQTTKKEKKPLPTFLQPLYQFQASALGLNRSSEIAHIEKVRKNRDTEWS